MVGERHKIGRVSVIRGKLFQQWMRINWCDDDRSVRRRAGTAEAAGGRGASRQWCARAAAARSSATGAPRSRSTTSRGSNTLCSGPPDGVRRFTTLFFDQVWPVSVYPFGKWAWSVYIIIYDVIFVNRIASSARKFFYKIQRQAKDKVNLSDAPASSYLIVRSQSLPFNLEIYF